MHIAVLLKTKSKKTKIHPNFAQQETAYKTGPRAELPQALLRSFGKTLKSHWHAARLGSLVLRDSVSRTHLRPQYRVCRHAPGTTFRRSLDFFSVSREHERPHPRMQPPRLESNQSARYPLFLHLGPFACWCVIYTPKHEILVPLLAHALVHPPCPYDHCGLHGTCTKHSMQNAAQVIMRTWK